MAPSLAELQAELSAVRAKIRSYDGGDRPMSPPAALMQQERDLEAQVRRAEADLAQNIFAAVLAVAKLPTAPIQGSDVSTASLPSISFQMDAGPDGAMRMRAYVSCAHEVTAARAIGAKPGTWTNPIPRHGALIRFREWVLTHSGGIEIVFVEIDIQAPGDVNGR